MLLGVKLLGYAVRHIAGPFPLTYWALFDAALFALVVAVRVGVGGWGFKDLGFTSRGLLRDLASGVVGFSLGRLVASPVEMLVLDARAGSGLLPLEPGSDYLLVVAAVFFGSFLWSSFPKELLFRGYVQSLVTRAWSWAVGVVAAAISSSLYYAAAHPAWEMGLALSTLPDAVMLGLTYAVTGSLIPVAVYHSLMEAAWAAEVAAYVLLGRVFGFIAIATIFTASLLALIALHGVAARVFVLGVKSLGAPSRREVFGGLLAGLALGAVLLVRI